uniref:Uncharacterized protein n=1 Tax=Clytia hemisphaerica TaxID=252671 RepID=A0A7M5UJ79_9CNID
VHPNLESQNCSYFTKPLELAFFVTVNADLTTFLQKNRDSLQQDATNQQKRSIKESMLQPANSWTSQILRINPAKEETKLDRAKVFKRATTPFHFGSGSGSGSGSGNF